MASLLYEAAIRYASHGIGTIPMAGRNGDKHPHWDLLPRNEKGEATWTPFQLANAPEPTLHRWFANGNGARAMALVCGEVSGNLAGLDFDTLTDGSCVYHEFSGLLSILEPSLTLPLERTPGGGYHLYFRTLTPLATSVLAADAGHNLIELKGNGSCLNCSPSPGYVPITSDLEYPPLLPEAQVKTILRICKSLDRTITKDQAERSSTKADGPLSRFDAEHTTQDMVAWLVAAGWTVRAEKRGETYLTRPGKDRGVSGTVGWNGLKIFRNFSANAAPFTAGQAYGAAGLKAMLSHDGNLRALASVLKARENGSAPRSDIEEHYNPPTAPPLTGEVTEQKASPEAPGSLEWFRTPKFPELPVMRSEWLGSPTLTAFAEKVSADREVPLDYVVGSILVALSAAVGNTRTVCLGGDWITYPQIWSCLVGVAGSGKTPAAEKVLEPTSARHGDAFVRYSLAKLEYEEERVDWNAKRGGNRGPAPKEPTLHSTIISDITMEEVAQKLHVNPRGLLLDKDELIGWINSFNQYKGGSGSDRSNWLSLWSCKPITVDRVNGTHIHVRSPFVAILGGTQPKLVEQAFKETADGLQDRILFFFPREEKETKERPYDVRHEPNAFAPLINNLYQLIGNTVQLPDGSMRVEPYEIVLSRGAWDVFEKARVQYARKDLLARSSAFSKAATQTGRIAVLLYLAAVYLDGTMEEGDIPAHYMECAVELVNYCLRVRLHLDWLAAGKERSTEVLPVKMKKLLEWVAKQPKKSATVRDIQRAEVARMRASSEIVAVMHELQELGFGTMAKITAGGRETHVFYLPE